MTRKHYLSFADAIKSLRGVPKRHRKQIANAMCLVFQTDNLAFDKARFMAACGL